MNDQDIYLKYQKDREQYYESICERCGKCCGAGGEEPCGQLALSAFRKYYCKVYHNRLGAQKTIAGNLFNCVPIREVLKYKDTLPDCVYRK